MSGGPLFDNTRPGNTFEIVNSSSVPSLLDQPAYPLAEAARYVHVSRTTLRDWVQGRESGVTSHRAGPLIVIADKQRTLLSFHNLVEAHVLRALRTHHGTPLGEIRKAIRYAEQELGIERLLLSEQLFTDGQHVFLEHYFELLNLSRSGQMAIKSLLALYLARVDRDARHIPIRLYPFSVAAADGGDKAVAIDPAIGFGRPIIAGKGISTATISARIDAGESAADVAEDYGITDDELTQAVLFEQAA